MCSYVSPYFLQRPIAEPGNDGVDVTYRFGSTQGEMREPHHGVDSFPSWRPQRNIDHILVTPTLTVDHVKALDFPLSDHLPVEMQITLPDEVRLGS